MKKLVSIILTLSILFVSIQLDIKTGVLNSKSADIISEVILYPQIILPFTPSDSAMDPVRHFVYITDKASKRVYSVNYETGSMTFLQFSLMPESIYFYNNEIFVSLMTAEHSAYWWTEDQTGAVAIIDSSTFSLTDQFNISTDPYDIVVSDGIVFVSSGSGQHTTIHSYSRLTKSFISKYYISQASNITMNVPLNKVYSVNTLVSPRDISTFNHKQGLFSSSYDSPYHGDYSMGTGISISPDGKYLFNSSGNIFTCNADKTLDMKYFGKLDQAYNTIEFNPDINVFYTADLFKIKLFDYNGFGYILSADSPGNVNNMFCNNEINKLIIVYDKIINNEKKYCVEAVKLPGFTTAAVITMINNLPFNIAFSDKQKVIDARTSYEYLSSEQKLRITNYNKLVDAEATIIHLDSIENYEFDPITGKIISYLGNENNIIIPSSVNGVTVKTIGIGAFAENDIVTKIVMPDTITEVQENAFFMCSSLASITFSSNLTTIGTMAFAGCSLLLNVTIPEKVVNVGYGVFIGTRIKTHITVDSGRNLIYYPIDYTTFPFPSGLKRIEGMTFLNNTNIRSITIPDTVTAIGYQAFSSCIKLAEAVIPASVTTLEDQAFSNCSALQYVTIPGSVNTFGDDIFKACNNLTILGYMDTPAYDYAIANNIPFVVKSETKIFPKIQLSFNPSDSVMDPVKPVVYLTDKASKKVYSVNYETGSMTFLQFSLMPESIYLYNNQIYVALMTAEHSSYWMTETQTGAVAIIDASTFSLTDQFNISTDPYDIVVSDGIVFVSSGSGKSTYIYSYSLATKSFISKSDIRQASFIEMNSPLNKVYAIDTDLSSRSIRTYIHSQGVFSSTYQSPYYEDYSMDRGISISPDSKYLFNSSGNIFTCNTDKTLDMRYYGSLGNPYNDIAFDLRNDIIYTADSKSIRKYHYNDLKFESSIKSLGDTKKIFYNEAIHKLINVYSKTENNILNYYVTTIDPVKDAENVVIDYIDALPSIIVLADRQTIIDARLEYEKLNAEQKSLVINYDKLLSAENDIEQLVAYFSYEFNTDTGTITKYTGSDTIVTIPSDINGVIVKEIGKDAFAGNSSITKIIMSNTIIEVESSAFNKCMSLSSVVFSNNLVTIGTLAFAECTSLLSVTIPASVLTVGDGVFCGSGITSPIIINNGQDLIYVPKTYTSYDIPNGVKRIIGMTFLSNENLESVTIPNTVNEIGVEAFKSCSFLTTIDLPTSVTRIDDRAFSNCTMLLYISIPQSVKTFGIDIFEKCDYLTIFGIIYSDAQNYAINNGIPFAIETADNYIFEITTKTIIGYDGELKNVVIPSQFYGIPVKAIGDYAFSYNENITGVTIPDSVNKIGGNSFYNCINLISVDIPLSIYEIGADAFTMTPWLDNNKSEYVIVGNKILIKYNGTSSIVTLPATISGIGGTAFDGCESLTSIAIPNSVTSIGDYSFSNCIKLKSITFSNTLSKIGEGSFMFCIGLSSVNLPQSLKTIADGSFAFCSGLAKIAIPDSVTSIGSYAFVGCENLAGIVLSKNITDIKSGTFSGCTSLKELIIPQNVKTLYTDSFADSSLLEITVLNKDMIFPKPNIFYTENYDSNGDITYAYRSYITIRGYDNSTAKTYCESLGYYRFIFKPMIYYWNVAFNSMGGSVVASKSVAENTIFTVPANPTRSGYIFAGWFTSTAFTTPWAFATNKVTANTTLYAKWIASQVTGLKVASAGYNSIKLTWTAAAGANYYEIYRASSLTGTYYLVTTIAATSVPTYTSTALGTGTTYYFKVRAYSLNSTTKTYNNYSTISSTKPLPATPTGLTSYAASYNSIKLSWTAVAGANGYSVYRATTSTGAYSLIATVTTNTYTKTALTTGATYYYKVNAYRLVGTAKVYGSQSVAIGAKVVPSTPTSLSVSSPSYNSLKLSWTGVYGANGYSVYRSTSPTGTYVLLATVTTNSYSNINLVPGTSYYYKVNAYRLVGTTKVYGSQCAVVGRKVVPATITTLTAVRYSATSIKINWGAISGASGYEIYRSTLASGTYTLVTTLTAISYINTSLVTGTTYYYKVRAYRLVGTTKIYADFSAAKYAKP